MKDSYTTLVTVRAQLLVIIRTTENPEVKRLVQFAITLLNTAAYILLKTNEN